MKIIFLLGALLTFISFFTVADSVNDRGWYAGGSIGSSSYDEDESLDDSDVSFSGFGGYKFNQHFSLQGNVVNLGKYEGEGGVLNSVDLNGFSFTANGILPLGSNGFEIYGRLGLAALKYTQEFDLLGSEIENSSTGDALVSAIGISYSLPIFSKIAFQLEYSNYYFVTERVFGDEDEESNSLGVFGVGLQYNF